MKTSRTADRLREIMDEQGLKQVDIIRLAKPFCDKYGVKLGKSDLSQYIHGKTEPQQDKLFILGLALNVSEGWLMGYDVPRERMSDAERFQKFANEFNKKFGIREKMLIDNYHQLTDANKVKLETYAQNLLSVQNADEELLAAHRERPFNQEDHDHDMEVIKNL